MSYTRNLVRGIATAAAGLALAVPFATAPAQADPVVDMEWAVNGSTTIKKLNKTVHLGPGTLKAKVDLGAKTIVGNLDVPPIKTQLDIGSLPLANVTIAMHEAAPVTGTVDLMAGFASTDATFNVQIVEIRPTLLPFLNLISGNCTTKTPAKAHLEGEVVLGGYTNLSTTFTLPQFKNCGLLTTPVINLAMSGPNNGMAIELF